VTKFLPFLPLKKVGTFVLFKAQKNVKKKRISFLSFNVDEENNNNNFQNECNVLLGKALHVCMFFFEKHYMYVCVDIASSEKNANYC
jgi:hypothetical protein